VIKHRNLETHEVWRDYDTEVFRSADSVTCKLETFGDMCAFHCNSGEVENDIVMLHLKCFPALF